METRNAPPSHLEHAAHRDNANHMYEEVDHRGTRGDQQGFDHQDMAAHDAYGHAGHDKHVEHSVEMFRDRF